VFYVMFAAALGLIAAFFLIERSQVVHLDAVDSGDSEPLAPSSTHAPGAFRTPSPQGL